MSAGTQRFERICAGAGSALVVVYALAPVAWIVSLSLKPAADLGDGRLVPARVTFDQYRAIFTNREFAAALVNSLGVAALATALSVALAAAAAYAIVRLSFPGRRALLAAALAVAMFPPVAIIGPLFNLWRLVGLYDTWPGLVLPYMTFSLPLALWTLTAFFRQIPWELEKAARVDGATRLEAFYRVIAPLAAPGVFASAALVFIFAWNDFLFALSLTSTDAARTVPAVIAFFTGNSQFERPTGAIAAASVVVTVPI
ncbi:MAG TPA: carbohydrate ABC transporter permease, partial [Gammaproteobacteria bacterium]|nr:carbohydrate ABC transporter permease [Gammaproteobacteria bacterium]